ncbi:MAG: L-histidine N(alpha)-methyltransferase [Alphaproteobacteria bacterium]|nr:L-histidine N(alpha)-methyltransferase [Alphaproteobacteria bacterium]
MYDSRAHARPNDEFSFLDFEQADESFRDALVAGLSQGAKAIPCRFLYDQRGSGLFDQICELPEYYPTRTETKILRDHAGDISRLVGPGASLIELGSGSSTKTRILLDRLDRLVEYIPIDVSRDHLRNAARDIAKANPAIRVTAICANYGTDWRLPRTLGRPVGFFPGSTIGNLRHAEARDLLAAWRKRLGPEGQMIVGVDLKKAKRLLDAAYDDASGITEAFIFNILDRANRELGADFDLSAFAYDAGYSVERGRVEMNLRSLLAQTVHVAGQTVDLAAGERIHVENSYKYDVAEFRRLAAEAGFRSARHFTDASNLFSVWVLGAG